MAAIGALAEKCEANYDKEVQCPTIDRRTMLAFNDFITRAFGSFEDHESWRVIDRPTLWRGEGP